MKKTAASWSRRRLNAGLPPTTYAPGLSGRPRLRPPSSTDVGRDRTSHNSRRPQWTSPEAGERLPPHRGIVTRWGRRWCENRRYLKRSTRSCGSSTKHLHSDTACVGLSAGSSPLRTLELLDLSAGFENVRQQVQVARMHAQVTRDRAKSTPIPLRACVDSAPHEQATQDGPTAAERAAADRPHGPGLFAVGVAATNTG